MENHLIYEICAVVATLVFIGIGIYLILALKALTSSLKMLNMNLSKVESKIEPLTNETVRLLENSNEIVESMQEKLTDLDPLMESITNVGTALKNVTSHFNQEESQFKFFHTEKKKDWQDIVGNLIKLATLGVVTWQKIKKGS